MTTTTYGYSIAKLMGTWCDNNYLWGLLAKLMGTWQYATKKMLHLVSCSSHWKHRHLILEHMSTIIDCWVNGGGRCTSNIGTMELVINIGKSDTPGRNDKNYQLPMNGWGWVWCLWVWCYEFSHTNPSNFQQLLQSLLLRYMAENLQVINLILICSFSSL